LSHKLNVAGTRQQTGWTGSIHCRVIPKIWKTGLATCPAVQSRARR